MDAEPLEGDVSALVLSFVCGVEFCRILAAYRDHARRERLPMRYITHLPREIIPVRVKFDAVHQRADDEIEASKW